jgi:signal transduction histidine kinase
MNDSRQSLAAEGASALEEYLAAPHEAGLLHAYELGRRALTHKVAVAELGIAYRNALAAALPGAVTPDEQARLAQRAAEFLGETLAPIEMILGGYREAHVRLQRLHQILAELQEASRRKDEFLAMLAHELRNPLAPMRNALEIMRLTRYDAREVGQASDLMERQVQHLARLIDDLMDVSRVTQGKVALRKEKIDVATVVRSALEISRPPMEAAGHALTVVLPQGPLVVRGDAVRLTQVVVNLLNNATKYTEPGGRIGLTVVRDGAFAVVRVCDSGIGIPAEMLPTIFDMFVQVPSARGRAQGGLGIGLTLVKSLVEMHDGSVEAHSAGQRQGSELLVRLPVVREEPPPQEPARE